jgi:hypothetical protein
MNRISPRTRQESSIQISGHKRNKAMAGVQIEPLTGYMNELAMLGLKKLKYKTL